MKRKWVERRGGELGWESVLSLCLVTLAGLLAIPVSLFCIEILAAVSLPPRKLLSPLTNRSRKRIAVLVPAHDESKGLLDTLNGIKAQLRLGDRLLVVADNCADDTAAIAKAAGAEVTERHDRTKVGKGYALEWGIRHLRADPPGIVIIVDADCELARDTLNELAAVSDATNRPVQARYLMTAPVNSSINYQVAMFAFRVKNWVRPLGLRALNLPCHLMGTGMAFPWGVISSADLATGAAVEDLRLGLEMTRAGHPPVFCPSTAVDSQFPFSGKGAQSQRTRWEHGHLGMIATCFPRLVFDSIAQTNFGLLVLALDMAVPPLTLLGMLLGCLVLIAGISVLFGLPSTSLIIGSMSLSAYVLAIMLCWLNFGRDLLPARSIYAVITYAIGKIRLYLQFVSGRGNSSWIRTDREETKEG